MKNLEKSRFFLCLKFYNISFLTNLTATRCKRCQNARLFENRIKAHFLICFLALSIYRFLERKLDYKYTCKELLDTLKAMNFAEVQEQGYMPLYKREAITDSLHEVCGFRTDYQFITKSKIRTIQKKSKGKV